MPGLVMPQQVASAQVPQASVPQAAQAGNPWQQAFQALSASLNTPNQSQAPAQYSAYQTPTPQAPPTQVSFSSPQAAPTYSPQASTQGYSAAEVQALVNQAASEGASQASDAYLSSISDQSLEVLQHFGAEAPQLLNTYACAVEDALIEQVGRNQQQGLVLEAAGEERAAMNLMLTDPDILADYVNDFFGPEGPYPTLTEAEERELAAYNAQQQFAEEIDYQEQNRQVPANFQRPQMEMPGRDRQMNAVNDFWGGFGEMMDNNPEDAWKYLAQAGPQALQTKMLVQDL